VESTTVVRYPKAKGAAIVKRRCTALMTSENYRPGEQCTLAATTGEGKEPRCGHHAGKRGAW
jgi:hypothetical protein